MMILLEIVKKNKGKQIGCWKTKCVGGADKKDVVKRGIECYKKEKGKNLRHHMIIHRLSIKISKIKVHERITPSQSSNRFKSVSVFCSHQNDWKKSVRIWDKKSIK